jgi:hypothetical protein
MNFYSKVDHCTLVEHINRKYPQEALGHVVVVVVV